MWEKIGSETFMAAAYVPCRHANMEDKPVSNNQMEIVIKHPDEIGVNYLCVSELKRTTLNKHLSAHKAPIYHKQVKKVKVIRHFHRPTSVFAEFT